MAGKRIFALSALIVFSTALLPCLPGQSKAKPQTYSQWLTDQPIEYQVAENTYQLTEYKRRLDELATVPTDVALIKQQMAQTDVKLAEVWAAISQIRTTAFTSVVGVMCWVIVQLFQFFEKRSAHSESESRSGSHHR